MIFEHFGLEGDSKILHVNGEKKELLEYWELEEVDREEAKAFRELVARMNYLSLDCPDLL